MSVFNFNPVTLSEHREAGHMVNRYVVTYVGKDGLRTLVDGAQGRYTYATPDEAQARLDAIFNSATNSASTLASVLGTRPRPEVRPCECWAGHFDPVGVYFD